MSGHMKTWVIRPAKLVDLSTLVVLEQECFAAVRRCSPRALRRSLGAPNQRVLLIEAPGVSRETCVAGAMILRFYPETARLFSLAVRPSFQRAGLGRLLVRAAVSVTRRSGRTRLSLEADLANRPLVDWYAAQGFRPTGILPDYYAPGEHAVRMQMALKGGAARGCQQSHHS